MTLRPIVLNGEPNRELRWLGHVLVPGLFDAEHFLIIQPLEDNRVRFVQREEFRGVLVPCSHVALRTTRNGGSRR